MQISAGIVSSVIVCRAGDRGNKRAKHHVKALNKSPANPHFSISLAVSVSDRTTECTWPSYLHVLSTSAQSERAHFSVSFLSQSVSLPNSHRLTYSPYRQNALTGSCTHAHTCGHTHITNFQSLTYTDFLSLSLSLSNSLFLSHIPSLVSISPCL